MRVFIALCGLGVLLLAGYFSYVLWPSNQTSPTAEQVAPNPQATMAQELSPSLDDPAPSPEADVVERESPATPKPPESVDSLVAPPAPDEKVTTEAPETDEAEVEGNTPEEKPSVRAADMRPNRPSPGEIAMDRYLLSDGYVPGEALDLGVAMEYPETAFPVTALAALETLPEGWEFVSVSSEPAPTAAPQAGAQGELTFLWVNIPQFPFNFVYTVRVPEEEGGGVRQVTGTALYRTNGPEQTTGEIATPVPPQ